MANTFPEDIDADSSPEVQMNENLEALFPFGLGAMNPQTTSGLTLGVYGGPLEVDGATSLIADTTLSLTNGTTNYVEMTRAGVISSNTTSYTAGRIRLGRALTAGSLISTWTDDREWLRPRGIHSLTSKSAAAGGTITLSADEARADVIRITGALPNNTSIVVPNGPQLFLAQNATSGSPTATLTFKTSGGSGVAVAEGKTQLLYADGTNVVAAAPVAA